MNKFNIHNTLRLSNNSINQILNVIFNGIIEPAHFLKK